MNLSTSSLEDELQLRSFGKWARSAEQRTKYPLWVQQMLQGHREDPRELIPDIDPDYAMRLDKMMTRLDPFDRDVLVSHYVGRQSFRSIAVALRTTDRNVRDVRDRALSYLAGLLQSS